MMATGDLQREVGAFMRGACGAQHWCCRVGPRTWRTRRRWLGAFVLTFLANSMSLLQLAEWAGAV